MTSLNLRGMLGSMRILFVFLFFFGRVGPLKAGEQIGSGSLLTSKDGVMTAHPLMVRSSPRTEIFFKDLKNSQWIDDDHNHNAFMNAFIEAAKKNKAISFRSDPETRKILKVEGVKDESGNDGVTKPVPDVVPIEAKIKPSPEEGGTHDLEKGNKEQKEK